MILAPALMHGEKDPKKAAGLCLDAIKLDPESYRLGHTKASIELFVLFKFSFFFNLLHLLSQSKPFYILNAPD
jgi:myosin heavy chain 6/7